MTVFNKYEESAMACNGVLTPLPKKNNLLPVLKTLNTLPYASLQIVLTHPVLKIFWKHSELFKLYKLFFMVVNVQFINFFPNFLCPHQ